LLTAHISEIFRHYALIFFEIQVYSRKNSPCLSEKFTWDLNDSNCRNRFLNPAEWICADFALDAGRSKNTAKPPGGVGRVPKSALA
jgi:hypothetical protein